MIRTYPGEPVAEPWTPLPPSSVLDDIVTRTGWPDDRPLLLGVDGRQGGGKTTIAHALAALVDGAAMVHSDDVAWWEAFFDWDHLMSEHILEPLRRGQDVDFQPPAWKPRGREGSIVVPGDAPLVVIEGVGVSRRTLAPLLDGAIWVQSDAEEARRRGIARDGGKQSDIDLWSEWDGEEIPFLAEDRPWERALAIVCGTPGLSGVDFDPETEVLVGRSLRP